MYALLVAAGATAPLPRWPPSVGAGALVTSAGAAACEATSAIKVVPDCAEALGAGESEPPPQAASKAAANKEASTSELLLETGIIEVSPWVIPNCAPCGRRLVGGWIYERMEGAQIGMGGDRVTFRHAGRAASMGPSHCPQVTFCSRPRASVRPAA